MRGELATSWRDPEAVTLAPDFLNDVPELLRQIVWRRGYRSNAEARAFLDPLTLRLPDDPLAPALPIAVDRIVQALEAGQRIAVWGDYDADGQTASAVLVGALRQAGADVVYHIPSCVDDQRGLNLAGLDRLAADGCRLVITCDCGTNDVEMVDRARALGLDMIISDHHAQIGPVPRAVAMLNSSLVPPGDALRDLPGVAVAYLLARAVLRRLDRAGDANEWLDLVAVGSIADIAPHTPTNRALLARGLPRLWRRQRPGIRALLDLAGKHPRDLDTEAISFTLGPVLNAAGRLGSPRDGVELLLAADAETAHFLAARMWALKHERNRLAAGLEQEIDARLTPADLEQAALVVAGPDWHPGVLGRVAGSVSRRYGLPALILSVPSDGGPARGSARAAGEIDLLAALNEQSRYLLTFGGHRGALGLSIDPEHIDAFRGGFVQAIAAQQAVATPGLVVDAVAGWSESDPSGHGASPMFDTLLGLAPFGEGNPEPVLANAGLRVVVGRRFGAGGRHLRLTLMDARGTSRDVIWWRYDPEWQSGGLIDVAYTVSRDEWQGQSSLQFTLRGIRPHHERSQDDR